MTTLILITLFLSICASSLIIDSLMDGYEQAHKRHPDTYWGDIHTTLALIRKERY